MEYEGAVYHVMNRGDRGGKIFKDGLDCDLFLCAMDEVCERAGWRIHSFVLMPNHFHWQLETPEGNLVGGMKWFLGAYTQRFNNRHGQRGHVYQGRYKAVAIETESGDYFETVSTYIHLNPARAGLLTDREEGLGQYPWSSYRWYMQPQRSRPGWLTVKRVLGNLDLKDDARGRRAYAGYIEDRMRELRTKAGKDAFKALWKQIRYGWYAGSEEFGEKLLEKLTKSIEGKQRASYSGKAIVRHDEIQAEQLITKGMQVLRIDDADLKRLPKGHEVKCALAWLAHTRTMASHTWLTERLHMGNSTTVSSYIKKVRLATNKPLSVLRNRLNKIRL